MFVKVIHLQANCFSLVLYSTFHLETAEVWKGAQLTAVFFRFICPPENWSFRRCFSLKATHSASSEEAVCVGGVGGNEETGDLVLPRTESVFAGPFVPPFACPSSPDLLADIWFKEAVNCCDCEVNWWWFWCSSCSSLRRSLRSFLKRFW